MNRKHIIKLSVALTLGSGCLFVSDHASPGKPDSWVSSAEARIGRPLTPMSYAGVARRTTRRAVAVGAATVGAGYYYSGCAQVVNAYGQIVTQCR